MPDDAGMRRCPRSVVAASLVGAVAACLAIGVPAANAALTGPQQVALLNQQRAAHGFPADIVEVPAWSAACKKHMEYIDLTGDFGHFESGPNMTTEGAWGGEHSVLVSAGDAYEPDGDNAFEHAPIHLMQMLTPFMKRSGADRGCLVTQGDGGPLEAPGTNTERVFGAQETYSYPGNGAAGVPIAEDTYELPFVPAASVGLSAPGDVTRSRGTGPHLYFYYAGPEGSWFSRGVLTAASLSSSAGAVEVKTVDNKTKAPASVGGADLGLYLSPGGIIIPTKPLTAGTVYVASVTFDPDGGEPVSRTWSFKTAGTAPVAIGGGTPGLGGGIGGSGGSGSGTTAAPAPAALPQVSKIKLKQRSMAFEASGAGALWVTVEHRTAKKTRTKPAKWKTRASLAATTTAAGRSELRLKTKLRKGTYRVRVRDGSAKGKILAEKTFTL